MLVSCWSVKGGSGTTVVAAALGLVLARTRGIGVLVADLAGDVPAALGVSAGGPGIGDWVAAGPVVGSDALHRLTIAAGAIGVLPMGESPLPVAAADDEVERFLDALHPDDNDTALTVVDGGRPSVGSFAAGVVRRTPLSLLVLRPCYLALRRAVDSPIRPTGVVLVDEPGRALDVVDIEDALDVPVVARVPHRPEIARAVDAGILAGRLPRTLVSSLRRAA